MVDEVSIGRILDAIEANRHRIGHVSNFPENYSTLWKDGRVEGWKGVLPIFHPSILPITKSVKGFLKHAPFLRKFGVR